MPLYVEDFEPLSLPHVYMGALMAMAEAIGKQPVNPGMALKLLQAFVRPLVPEEHRAMFDLGGQASWQRVRMLYPKLAFASFEGQDKGVLAAARLVDLMVRHTAKPPRELDFPRFVEVSSFTRICGYLGLPVTSPCPRIALRDLQLHEFCKYCWLPARSHGVCGHHSSLRPGEKSQVPTCAVATLKQAQRLREAFEQRLIRLITAEELAFHDSEFAEPVLLPPSGLATWLEMRRPALARAIRRMRPEPDSRALSDLLTVLYGEAASEVGAAVAGGVYLLTPITARAEAWLCAWEDKPGWGGARPGSGQQ